MFQSPQKNGVGELQFEGVLYLGEYGILKCSSECNQQSRKAVELSEIDQ